MEPISRYEIRDELRRVLQSRHFAKARKRSRFLEFVCEQALVGNAEKLNEYLIGVEVYGRGPNFNPQEDAIVRVQATEIRRALKEYYASAGRPNPWRIDLPAGHYLPLFTRAPEVQLGTAAAPAVEVVAPHEFPGGYLRRHALVSGLGLACAVLAALALWQRFTLGPFAPARRGGAQLVQEVGWFWGPFLPPADAPLIVMPNHPLLRAAHDGDTPATLDQSYLIPKEKLPDFRDTIHFRELRGFHFVPSTTDFTSMGEALGLASLFEFFGNAGQKVRVKPARLADFETVKRGNVILLGGNQSWSGRIYTYPEGFLFRAGVITNRTPGPGEQPVYKPEFDPVTNSLRRDYALVLMLPNENREQRVLLIYGIFTQGSQAAIEYVTSAARLRELRGKLAGLTPAKKLPPRFFEALLTTTVENSVPGKVSFVAARAIPE